MSERVNRSLHTSPSPFVGRKRAHDRRDQPGRPLPTSAYDMTDEEPRFKPIDWPLIRRMLEQLRPYRRRYALGIALGVLMVVLEMQSPLFIRGIINTATQSLAVPDGHRDSYSVLSPQSSALSPAVVRVAGIVALWAAVMAAALALNRLTILIMVNAGERVQFDIRRALFAHLQKLSMSYYDRTKFGWIISRCTNDVSSLRDINVWGLDTVVKNLLMMLVAAGMLLATEPRLFLAVAWLGPILFVCNRVYRVKAGHAQQVVRRWFTRVSSNLAENITGVRVVTAFHRQEINLDAFNALQEVNTANNVRVGRINGLYQPLLQLIGFTGRVVILMYGGYLAASGSIAGGVGAVVAAFLYWDWFMQPILSFGNFYTQLTMALAAAERVYGLLDTQPEVADLPDAGPLPRIEGRVRFEHVTFGYRPDRPVLFDIDFEARPGQTVALVGPTGGGKSSIISLLARFYQPQEGRVLVDGHDLRAVTGESLHRQTGLVLQINYLFTGTVMDNIRYGRPDATDDEVIEAARALGSDEAIMALADGYSTEVGERGANMSLGQRQLICFTRAFLADPRIFMLDEATSSVDTATEMIIQRSLEKLRQGRTTFIVAHRLSTIQRADIILVIETGRIVERGTHGELLAAGGAYARLYEEFAHSREGG